MSKELYLLLIQGLPGLLITGKYALSKVPATRFYSISQAGWTITFSKERLTSSRQMANKVNLDHVAKGPVSYAQQLAKARPGRSPGYMYLSTTSKQVIAFYPFSTISFNELVQT